MAKARKFGLGGTIKKTVEKTVEAAKNTPKKAVEVTRGAVDKKDSIREYPPVPKREPVKGVATPFVDPKAPGTRVSSPVKGVATPFVDPKAPGTRVSSPVKGIDTPIPGVKTGATGPSKDIISKVAELKDIKTPQIRPATPTVPAVQSERLNAVKDMARPVTPKPSTPALAPKVSTADTPRSPLGGKPPALAAFNPKGMKKGGAAKSYKAGGTVSGASKRGDGIAIRGKTRGKIC